MTERDAVLVAFERHVADGKEPLDFKFKYERYKEKDVQNTLRRLFDGKCAYCESRYGVVQPMDVEHWRPKGEVHEGGEKLPGYYWLASDWDNLYPSCIDCNRSRNQLDAVINEEVRLGKANQFPVTGTRLTSPEDDTQIESPVLLDPCSDDPDRYFRFREDGAVVPAAESGDDHERAAASIRVFGLNRTDLVAERLATRTMVDHRLMLIGKLGVLRDARADDAELHEALTDLIAVEIDVLVEMMEPDRPYSGMVRQMIQEADPRT